MWHKILSFSLLLVTNISLANPQAIQFADTIVPLFSEANLEQEIGFLEAGSPLLIIQQTDQAMQIELTAWRKAKGFGRIWYHQFAKQIRNAVIDKTVAQNPDLIQVLESRNDELTGLTWQRVRTKVWVKKQSFVTDLDDFWAEIEAQYKEQCSVCHKQRDPKLHDSNQWIAVFNGMVNFTDLEDEEARRVLRYLQLNALDSREMNE